MQPTTTVKLTGPAALVGAALYCALFVCALLAASYVLQFAIYETFGVSLALKQLFFGVPLFGAALRFVRDNLFHKPKGVDIHPVPDANEYTAEER